MFVVNVRSLHYVLEFAPVFPAYEHWRSYQLLVSLLQIAVSQGNIKGFRGTIVHGHDPCHPQPPIGGRMTTANNAPFVATTSLRGQRQGRGVFEFAYVLDAFCKQQVAKFLDGALLVVEDARSADPEHRRDLPVRSQARSFGLCTSLRLRHCNSLPRGNHDGDCTGVLRPAIACRCMISQGARD